jgi:hypothetical protein
MIPVGIWGEVMIGVRRDKRRMRYLAQANIHQVDRVWSADWYEVIAMASMEIRLPWSIVEEQFVSVQLCVVHIIVIVWIYCGRGAWGATVWVLLSSDLVCCEETTTWTAWPTHGMLVTRLVKVRLKWELGTGCMGQKETDLSLP